MGHGSHVYNSLSLRRRGPCKPVRFAIVIALLAASPCVALEITYPITVLPDCVELATREGFPLQMHRADAERAKRRMHQLGNRDPMVRKCRDAIEQFKNDMK